MRMMNFYGGDSTGLDLDPNPKVNVSCFDCFVGCEESLCSQPKIRTCTKVPSGIIGFVDIPEV